MYNPVISVIVPVYNNAVFLPKCIESILSQTYSYFELLLINDGSKDESGKICDDYALHDDRVRVFHQDNSGVSFARNKGLKEAKGKYICFVDSDDWVKNVYLEDLINAVVSDGGSGLVVQGLEQYSSDSKYIKSISFPNLTLRGNQMAEVFTKMELYFYGYSCSKLYYLSVLKENDIYFNTSIDHAEDLLFMIDYIKRINYIRFCDKNNYVYIVYSGSLSNRNRSYITEIKCYEIMKMNIFDIQTLYHLNSDSLNKMVATNALFLIRALPALYRPPYALSKKERIKELGKFTSYEFDLLRKTDYSYRFLEKIGNILLCMHLTKLYDAYMSFVFFVRYYVVK
jgi:glycosyltransferase involved in cell wall biosynthesis